MNENYKLCDTYPKLLAVPNSSSDQELQLVAGFRSKNRVPVLSWVKNDPNNANENPAILRCSQPLCGMAGKRSYWDELYLKNVAEANESNKFLHIMDARP